jgi:hypothetical protein
LRGLHGRHPPHVCWSPSHPTRDVELTKEGWHVVARRKQWWWIAIQAPPPRQPHWPVPVDLVGRCFNCLRQDHVAVDCPNASRCLRCHREGHCTRTCKCLRSPDAAGPPLQTKHPQMVAVLHPCPGDVALGHPCLMQPPRRTLNNGVPSWTMAA